MCGRGRWSARGMRWPSLSTTAAMPRRKRKHTARRSGYGLAHSRKPWEWRAGVLETVQPATAGECVIKGNISRRGERIYYMPFHAFYARTQIDEGAGERMFCTEDETHAGWRRALR